MIYSQCCTKLRSRSWQHYCLINQDVLLVFYIWSKAFKCHFLPKRRKTIKLGHLFYDSALFNTILYSVHWCKIHFTRDYILKITWTRLLSFLIDVIQKWNFTETILFCLDKYCRDDIADEDTCTEHANKKDLQNIINPTWISISYPLWFAFNYSNFFSVFFFYFYYYF